MIAVAAGLTVTSIDVLQLPIEYVIVVVPPVVALTKPLAGFTVTLQNSYCCSIHRLILHQSAGSLSLHISLYCRLSLQVMYLLLLPLWSYSLLVKYISNYRRCHLLHLLQGLLIKPTVASDPLLLLQVPPATPSLSCVVAPAHTVRVPVIAVAAGLTVTAVSMCCNCLLNM